MKGRITFIGVIVFVGLILLGVASAEVGGLSLEREKVAGVQRYLEVTVTCSDGNEVTRIRKSTKHGAKWCSVDEAGSCDKSKYTLARELCASSGGELGFLAAEGSQSDERAASLNDQRAVLKTSIRKRELLAEQMLIEEQRISIEQRRLELVELELSLKRTHVAALGE